MPRVVRTLLMLLLGSPLLLISVAQPHGLMAERPLAISYGSPTASTTDGSFAGTIDIGGRALYLNCAGEGTPTVIIDHGQWGSSANMEQLQYALSRDTRVCVYDRVGTGRSDPPAAPLTTPPTAADVVSDLHALLEAADVPGPYVLVGHSAGGAFVQLYARAYPEEVVGVAAMNAVPPADRWLDEATPLMTKQERGEELAYYAGMRATEDFDWNTSFTQLDAAGPPPAVPFLVLISTIAQCASPDDICGRTYGVYETVMEDLAAQWPQGRVTQLEAEHEIYERPEAVAAIRQLLDAVRNPRLWLPSATPAPASTPHPFAGETAWVAYYSGEGIGLIHPDGTGDHPVAIDTVPGEELLAEWSPDGTRLVFTTRGGETDPLFEYDLATEASRQLFACEAPCLGDDEPVYAPDGERVAFIRGLAPFVMSEAIGSEVPSDCGLWIGERSSGAVTQITSNTDPPCDREYSLHWSSDGTQLTYWRNPYAKGEPTGTAVYVINADGTGEQRLTDPAMFAGSPDWSPDGEWLVFSTYPLLEFQCCQVSNLYRMHPDGSGMEQLTHYETEDLRATQPRYTPDGEWIVFTAVRPTSRNLWAIPSEGGEPIILTTLGTYTHGTWQPTPTT